jgi:hypothetical protein
MPTLPEKARKIVLGMVDMMLYCDLDVAMGDEGGKPVILPRHAHQAQPPLRSRRPNGTAARHHRTRLPANSSKPSRRRPVRRRNRRRAPNRPSNFTTGDNTMSRHSIDLSQFDDDFRAEQPEERGDFESVPDGKYQVTVEKVELTEAQIRGQPDDQVDAADSSGRSSSNRLMWRNSVITQNTLKYVKTDLHTVRARSRHVCRICRSTCSGCWT